MINSFCILIIFYSYLIIYVMASGDILPGQLTQAGAGVGQLNRTVGSDTLTIREVGEQNYLSKDMAGNVLRETNNNEVKDPEEKQDEKVLL